MSSSINDNKSCLHIFQELFCIKCGTIKYDKSITLKHPKYNYKAELNPVTLLFGMITSNQSLSLIDRIDNQYLHYRCEIITILRSINSRLNFNSQTFFLAVCYIDEICTKNIPLHSKGEYILMALSCFLIASKFSENDPNVPEMTKYLFALSDISKYIFTFSIEDFRRFEVTALKYLEYKLNYYSVYHFITFFFTHGVLLNNSTMFKPEMTMPNENSHVNTNTKKKSIVTNDKRLLEKIYIRARELLDFIIEDPNYVVIGKDNIIAAIEILRKAIEINSPINPILCHLDVFTLIYQIDDYISKPRIEIIRRLINKIYIVKILKQQEKEKPPTVVKEMITIQVNKHEKIKEEENNKTKIDTIKTPKKKPIQFMNTKISASLLKQKSDLTQSNHKQIKQISIKKRPSSSNKNRDGSKYILHNISNKISNHGNNNHIFFHQETAVKQTLDNHIDPIYHKYNKKPPINSIRIKKDFIGNEEINRDMMVNTTKNAQKNTSILYNSGITDIPKRDKQQQDILDKTKMIFELSKRNKNEIREHHYSAHEAELFKMPLNESANQAQSFVNNPLSSSQNYNTIIINNNININTYIQKKGTYDVKRQQREINQNKNEEDSVGFLSGSTNNIKLTHYQSMNKIANNDFEPIKSQNYFGTYFDYGSDSMMTKLTHRFNKEELLNASANARNRNCINFS